MGDPLTPPAFLPQFAEDPRCGFDRLPGDSASTTGTSAATPGPPVVPSILSDQKSSPDRKRSAASPSCRNPAGASLWPALRYGRPSLSNPWQAPQRDPCHTAPLSAAEVVRPWCPRSQIILARSADCGLTWIP